MRYVARGFCVFAAACAITGGTGRFAEASGSLVLQCSLNLLTLFSSASITGTISLGH